jgi:hypothetical protein
MIQPYEDLAKFDYNLGMKVKIFKIFFYIFWLHVGTYCRNFWQSFVYVEIKILGKKLQNFARNKFTHSRAKH